MKIGLVLEGGGMRGLYTVGALDVLMERGITFDYCIGVSAGACNAVSFLSGQQGRGKRVILNYIGDKRYVGIGNFLREHSLFGMDFIFNQIPHELDPFDYETFLASPCEFVAGVTDVTTGAPAYFGREVMDHDSTVLRASSAIPLFSPIVQFQGGEYLDGGTSDPIPVKKALADGCEKVLVVLTRDRSYEKSPESFRHFYRRAFRKYPEMIRLLDTRHTLYNETRRQLWELEKQGTALVVAPSSPVEIGRFEKDREKLEALYQQGRGDMLAQLEALREVMGQRQR